MLNLYLCSLLVPFSGSTEPVPAPGSYTLDDKPVMHRWTGTLNVGAIVTDGNTETNSANAAFDAQYRREKDRTTFGAYWNYQDDKSGVLQRRTGGKANYDYFFAEKTYGLAQASAEYDFQADLDLRWIAGVGAGRQFIETAERKFSAEVGVSWVDENFAEQPGVLSGDKDYAAARGAYTYDWVINPKWSFYNAGEIYPSLEDGDDVNAKEDTRLKVTLTDTMFAQAQWVMDWDNTPAAGKERVDNRYILTLGWSF